MNQNQEPSMLDMLREVDFLDSIADEHLGWIAQVGRQMEFAQGELIFREGEPASQIYLIVRGRVSLEICAPGVGCRRILTVGEGELLGCSPVLDQARLTATARAAESTLAIAISGQQILTLCEHDARFGYEFMRRAALALAKRLAATRMQLLDVFGPESADTET